MPHKCEKHRSVVYEKTMDIIKKNENMVHHSRTNIDYSSTKQQAQCNAPTECCMMLFVMFVFLHVQQKLLYTKKQSNSTMSC